MKLIIIRHGEPDYGKDSLTKKGWREAALLAERVARWQVTDFYCSPLGRAKDTAADSLARLGRTATTCEWLKEFNYYVDHPVTARRGIPWDFIPSYWTAEPLLTDRERWFDAPVYQSNPDIKVKYQEVCTSLDELLSRYGYRREGNLYRTDGRETIYVTDTPDPEDLTDADYQETTEDVVVFFCHLGIASVLLSHLLGIPFPTIPHSFFLAPTSVTILGTEEHWDNEAFFRVQAAGDTSHLKSNGEPISPAGSFNQLFQG